MNTDKLLDCPVLGLEWLGQPFNSALKSLSENCLTLLEFSASELTQGTRFIEQIHPDDLPLLKAPKEPQKAICFRFRQANGHLIWLQEMLCTPNKQHTQGVLYFTDVSHFKDQQLKLESQIETLQGLAATDSLTGLLNRNEFERRGKIEVARAQRYGQEMSVMMFDLDDFKTVNDRFGHQAGDEVIRHLSNILLDELREPDIVGRYGGEEFIVLLPETACLAALEPAERVRKRLASIPLRFETIESQSMQTITQTISAGIAQHDLSVPLATTILAADQALYSAKKSGKNQVKCHS